MRKKNRVVGRIKSSVKRVTKLGMPPESLVYTGEKQMDSPQVSLFHYNADDCKEEKVTDITQLKQVRETERIVWLNVEGLHDVELIAKIGEIFSLHPLVMEDILDITQRPKFEIYDDMLFLVVKMLSFDEKNNKITTEQVCFLLSDSFLITFQEGMIGDVFDGVRERITKGKGKLRKNKVDYLCYELLDSIVDNYFLLVERIGDKITELEDEVFESPEKTILHSLHELRNELLTIRKAVWPMREVVTRLEREAQDYVSPQTQIYLRDLYDHTIQEIETIEALRESLAGLQDLYLSSLSNKMNEVMKVLTIITTIFIPLSFIAGVYGMNFEHMPELKWQYGYYGVIALMTLISLIMLVVFRRKKWL